MNKVIFFIKSKIVEYRLKDIKISGDYVINPDLTVTVHGSVNMSGKNLSKIPVKFKSVGGEFDCSFNKLKDLIGSPEFVGGSFYCESNRLNSLKGCPNKVLGQFGASDNNISTFEYFPIKIGKTASFTKNPILGFDTLPFVIPEGGVALDNLDDNNKMTIKLYDKDYFEFRNKKNDAFNFSVKIKSELEEGKELSTPKVRRKIKI